MAGVVDPELPAVTLGQLGMIHDVRIEGGQVTVELLPTFAGCPAQELMQADVSAAVGAVSGVEAVTVRFRFDPPWTSARITPEGRQALAGFGIAPPPGADGLGLARDAEADGPALLPVVSTAARVACPYCGSAATRRDSWFGPTPCRALWYCSACRQPFEAFKPL